MALVSFRWHRILRTSISTILGCGAIGAVGTMGLSALLNWDPLGVPATPGGAGTWDYTSALWDNSGTLVNWTDVTGVDTGVFKATGALVTLGAPMTANGLRFDVTGYTIGSATNTLSLVTAAVAGPAPLITNNAANVTSTISASLLGNDGINLTATNGVTTNPGTKTTLSGDNKFIGGVTITSGTVELGNAGALNQSIPNTLTFGTLASALNLKGNSVAIRDLSGTTNLSSISNGLAGTATLTVYQLNDKVVKTVLSNGAAGTLALVKDGPATLTLGSDNTYSGATTVRGSTLGGTVGGTESGTLELAGNNVGRLTATSSINLSDTGTFKLTNTSAANSGDRIPTVPINMSGGSFVFGNDGSTASYTETTGALTISAGANNVYSQQVDFGGPTTVLTFASLARNPGTVVNFASQYQPSDRPLQIGASTQNRVVFTAAPAVNDGMIGGGVLFDTSDFATYDTANSITSIKEVTYAVPAVSLDQTQWTTTTNVKYDQTGVITLSDPTFTGIRTVNSLNLAADPLTLNLSGFTLNIDTGGLISQLQSSNGSIDNGVLTAGTTAGSDLVLTLPNATGTLTISGSTTIVNNGVGQVNTVNLVKAGPGKVILAGPNPYTGDTSILGGTLQIDSDGEIGSGSGAVKLKIYDGTLAVTAGFTLANRRAIEVGGNAIISVAAGSGTSGKIFTYSSGNISSLPGTEGSLTFLSNATEDPSFADPGKVNIVLTSVLSLGGSLRIDATSVPGRTAATATGVFRPNLAFANSIGRSLQVGMNGSAFLTQTGGSLSVGSGFDDTLDLGVKDALTFSSVAKEGTLTLTGLTQFTAKVDLIRLGVQTQSSESVANGSTGVATLATNNDLTAGTSITISDNANTGQFGGGVNLAPSKVDFGAGTNNVTTQSMLIGGGRGTAIVGVATNGTLNLKGFAERTLNLSIGRNDSFDGVNSTGTLDVTHLTSGTATTGTTFTGSFDNLIIGQKTNSTLAAQAIGSLIFGTSASNAVVANSLQLGVDKGFNGTASASTNATGTLTVGGGSFTVYNDVALGTQAGKGSARGNLNLNGGTFNVGGNITKTNSDLSNSVIVLNGATLNMRNPLVNDTTSGAITASQLDFRAGSLTSAASVTLDGRDITNTSALVPLINALIIRDVSLPAPLSLTGAVADKGGVQYSNVGGGAGATLASVSLGTVGRTFDIGHSGSNAADLTVTGAVTGVVPLTKTGVGVLQLNGAVAGSVTVVAGQLDGASGNIAGAVNIGAAGTLGAGGKGTIGNFATGTETFAANATLSLDINFVARTSDQLNVTGNIALDSGNTTKLVLQDLNQIGTFTFFSLPIVNYSGTWNGGLFTVGTTVIDDYDPANPSASTKFFVGPNRYAIDYNYNGNTIALISVPEPGSLALLAGGVALLGGMRRRRSRTSV